MTKERYDYWVIRYVPDAVVGEYVNVAVVAAARGEVALARATSMARAAAFGTPEGAQAVSEFLDRLRAQIDAPRSHFDVGNIVSLAASSNNFWQFSPSAPVLAVSARSAAAIVFTHRVRSWVSGDPAEPDNEADADLDLRIAEYSAVEASKPPTSVSVTTRLISERGIELPWSYTPPTWPGREQAPTRSGTAWIPLGLLEDLDNTTSDDANFGGPGAAPDLAIGQERALLALGLINKATKGNCWGTPALGELLSRIVHGDQTVDLTDLSTAETSR